MCTISWIGRADGTLVLCFSRDERRSRATGLPPRLWRGGFLAPVDADAGGTWLAVRPDGMVLALLNHYPADFSPLDPAASRGSVIPALAVRPDPPGL